MDSYDIRPWVQATQESSERQFREAVHTVLVAIANAPHLHTQMLMKGGILLALQYRSVRHTRDIDFSTPEKYQVFELEPFLSELSQALALAVAQLDYGLDCRVQSHEVKPPRPDATMPTLKVRIGYAYQDDPKAHRRLLNRRSTNIVEVDYSFNEPNNEEMTVIELIEGGTLRAYSLVEVIAEKYRAMLQQETRGRVRRQDAYDLYHLLRWGLAGTAGERRSVLDSLQLKADARTMTIDRDSILREEVIRRSRADYPSLQPEVEEPLPDFDEVYRVVREFYQSLPWER